MIGADAAQARRQRRLEGRRAAWEAEQASRGLTPLRSAVFEVIQATGRPVRAYDLIARLQEKLGRRVGPPTVYRSLDYLCRAGLVARLESMNAFMARSDPAAPRGDVIFICGRCLSVEEVGTPYLSGLLDRSAFNLGFRIERRILELDGTCARCLAVTDGTDTLTQCEELTP